MNAREQLAVMLSASSHAVFFGGAGVSTASGIPDFRSADGLYTEEEDDGIPPEEKLHIRYLTRNPEGFYRYYRKNMLYPGAKPNAAHLALARLEAAGKLDAIVTQNIDGLHEAAGSRLVFTLHGTVAKNHCVRCGKAFGLSYILGCEGVPLCDACGGIVRPDVTLYGESLPEAQFDGAITVISRADLLLVGGTSLTVYPAAGLVRFCPGKLVIVNRSETPYDSEADLIIREPIESVLSDLCSDLKI